MAEQYTYAVARIHAMEASLLTLKDLEQVLLSKDEEEAVRVLSDKGFSGFGNYKSVETLLSEERAKTVELISKLLPDSREFDVFLYPDDFHNLKAAVKALFSGERDGIYLNGGIFSKDEIIAAVKEKNFSALPECMGQVAEEAISTLAKTGDGQLADIIIDRAALETIYESGQKSDNEIIRKYSELFVALSDLKIAARGAKMKKSFDFLVKAFAECKTLDAKRLSFAASKGEDELFEYLSFTPYSESVEILKKSYTEFEKWCDNKIMALMAQQKSNPFTIAPIAAYYFARETEMKAVRMVLSGVINKLDENLIKERLRDLYV